MLTVIKTMITDLVNKEQFAKAIRFPYCDILSYDNYKVLVTGCGGRY